MDKEVEETPVSPIQESHPESEESLTAAESLIAQNSSITGLSHRKRLQKHHTPTVSLSTLNDIPDLSQVTESQSLAPTWMDLERHQLQAYEYLCHVSEAKEWVEKVLSLHEKTWQETDTVQWEESLRNGIMLAQLAQCFAPAQVKKIYTASGLTFRHSDNIVFFLKACQAVGLPRVFYFELVDLYDKKNVPRVMYCLHALGHFLAKRGLAPKMRDLVGQLTFTSGELDAKHQEIQEQGVTLPAFDRVVEHVAEEWVEATPEQNLIRITQLQAQIRGHLQRAQYQQLKKSIQQQLPSIIALQSQCRSFLAKRLLKRLKAEHEQRHFAAQLIQSFYRMIRARRTYRAFLSHDTTLTLSMMRQPLFQQAMDYSKTSERNLELLREKVIRLIRLSMKKEEELHELDLRIGVLVKNRQFIQQQKQNASAHSSSTALNASLPKEVATLTELAQSLKKFDKPNQRRWNAYQHLFYLLQTQPHYLSQLLFYQKTLQMNQSYMDQIILALFGYAQQPREEYLLLTLIERVMEEEWKELKTIQDFIKDQTVSIRLAVHLYRGIKERAFLAQLLAPWLSMILSESSVDETYLELDPLAIYRHLIQKEELLTGEASARPFDVSREEALQWDAVRVIYESNQVAMKLKCRELLDRLQEHGHSMPFGVRYLAKKLNELSTTNALQASCYLVYYRYMNPAIVAPEAFDVLHVTISQADRKRLAQVATMMHHITLGSVFEGNVPGNNSSSPSSHLTVMNPFIQEQHQVFNQWLLNLIKNTSSLKEYYERDVLLDVSESRQPVIYISPKEIFLTHCLIQEHEASTEKKLNGEMDAVQHWCQVLGPFPLTSQQILAHSHQNDAILSNATAMTLLKQLNETNSAMTVNQTWQQVHYCLSVLMEKMPNVERVSDFINNIDNKDDNNDNVDSVDSESVSQLQLKLKQALEQLSQRQLVSPANDYYDALLHFTHHLRQCHLQAFQLEKEMSVLRQTLLNVQQKCTFLDAQISSYQSYVSACLQQLSSTAKKKSVMPLSKQYWRGVGRQDKAELGAWRYTAQELVKRGILLSIDGVSTQQLNRIDITIACDTPGLFQFLVTFRGLAAAGALLPKTELALEDLLELQFQQVPTLLVAGVAKVHVNLMIALIQRKFYKIN